MLYSLLFYCVVLALFEESSLCQRESHVGMVLVLGWLTLWLAISCPAVAFVTHRRCLAPPTKAHFAMVAPSGAYFVAGGLACMISHTVAVPFDVIKTRQQTSSTPVSLKQLIEAEGAGILLQGLGPTLLGYAVQGSLKYGFYELFKPALLLALHIGPGDSAVPALMLAGALSESIGSTALSPFEAARIRLVSNPSFAQGVLPCLNKIQRTEGTSALFFGLPAILAKQLPYTVVQLSSFETLSAAIAGTGVTTDRFAISVCSALVAAFLSSLASQPGDTLLSIVNKTARRSVLATSPAPVPPAAVSSISTSPSARDGKGIEAPPRGAEEVGPWTIIGDAIRDLGLRGLFRGTKARLLHVGVIVVSQLLIYDSIKAALGIPLPGGAGGH